MKKHFKSILLISIIAILIISAWVLQKPKYHVVPEIPFEYKTVTESTRGLVDFTCKMVLPIGWRYQQSEYGRIYFYNPKYADNFSKQIDSFYEAPYCIEVQDWHPESASDERVEAQKQLMKGNPQPYIDFMLNPESSSMPPFVDFSLVEEDANSIKEEISVKYYTSDNNKTIAQVDVIFYGTKDVLVDGFKYHTVKFYRSDLPQLVVLTAVNENLENSSADYGLWAINSMKISKRTFNN